MRAVFATWTVVAVVHEGWQATLCCRRCEQRLPSRLHHRPVHHVLKCASRYGKRSSGADAVFSPSCLLRKPRCEARALVGCVGCFGKPEGYRSCILSHSPSLQPQTRLGRLNTCTTQHSQLPCYSLALFLYLHGSTVRSQWPRQYGKGDEQSVFLGSTTSITRCFKTLLRWMYN